MSWNLITYKNPERSWTFATNDKGSRFLNTHMLSTHNARLTVNIYQNLIALEPHKQRYSAEPADILNIGQRKIEIYSSQAGEVCDMLLEYHKIDGWFTFPTIDFAVLTSFDDYNRILAFAAELEERDRELFTPY